MGRANGTAKKDVTPTESRKSTSKVDKCRGKERGNRNAAVWEARLRRMGLDMGAGNRNFIDYGYSLSDLASISDTRLTNGKESRGGSLEYNEWPVSLT
jgi:hypothetical protein